MKNILLLILLFIALPAWSQSVQYRPTAYTAPFVSTINSAAAAQTYLGIPSSTNNALLSGTNVFTGTNRFTGTVLITNSASTISGNGAGLTNLGLAGNKIRMRSLFFTNVFVSMITTSSIGSNLYTTNNGDYNKSGAMLAVCRLPALLSTNSAVIIGAGQNRTNAQANSMYLSLWAGPNTNYLWLNSPFFTQASKTQVINPSPDGSFLIMQNYGSFTNQIAPGASFPPIQGITGLNVTDTSVPFDVYVGVSVSTAGGAANTNSLFFIYFSEIIP